MKLKYKIPTSLEHLKPIILRYIALIGLVILIIASVVNATPTNLLTNGGFETWNGGVNVAPTGWTSYGIPSGAIARSTNSTNGSYSVSISRSGTEAGIYQNISNIDEYKNKYLTATVRIRSATSGVVHFISLSDGVSVNTTQGDGSAFTYTTVTKKIASNATYIRVNISVPYADGQLIYADDAVLTLSLVPPTIIYPVDGALSDQLYINASWEQSEFIPASLSATTTYHYIFSNTSDYVYTIEGNTTSLFVNTTAFTGNNFLKIIPNTTLINSSSSSSVSFYLGATTLYTPANNSNFDIVFPDLTDDVFFSWSLPSGYASNLQIAEDSAFNTIAYDDTLTNSNHTIALGAGVYKWRVRFYNITAEQYYAWGNVFNFTVTSTPPTLTGTAIYGVVYKLVDGVQTPISSAEVRLSDNLSSTSYSTITGSNGYFAFENLANYKTYYLQAKKPAEYDDSAIELITTGSGTQTEKNLLMVDCTVAYNCFYGKVNLKLIVADIWTNTYENIAIAVYAGSDVIASYTGTTGSDGSETFSLVKTQQYRITFINATQGISETRTITPGDQNELYIIVSPSGGNWWNPPSTVGNTGFTVSTNEINSTHAYVNATYTDNLAASTWTIYLNQTNHSNGTAPQIIIQSTTGSNNGTASFMISNYKGMSYLVNLKATHTTLGTIQRSFGVAFEGLQSTALDFISNFMKMLISIAIIIFVGAMFGQSSVNQGALVVCGLGWVFLGIGFFAYFDTVKMAAGLLIATVFAVFMNMNARARQEDIT